MPTEILPEELAQKLASEPVFLLDVRQPEEHTYAAIPGTSRLIPLSDLPARLAELPQAGAVPLIVYCHHGVRSWMAAQYLEAQGWIDVKSLVGGIDAWSLEVDATISRY